MQHYTIGITLAPRFPETITKTIRSLRDSGFNESIFLFCEPGNYVTNPSDDRQHDLIEMIMKCDNNVTFVVNDQKLGCFKNYHEMASMLVQMATFKKIPYIFTIQDDFTFTKESYQALRDLVNHPMDFWYCNFHTRPRMEKFIYRNWRNNVNLGRYARGMCYFYPTHVLKDIINHPFYLSHLNTYTKNQQIDACISETLIRMKKPMFYHNPSLSVHDGESTIWHTDGVLGEYLDERFTKRIVGVASIQSRKSNLRDMIDSVYHQVDEIHVYLNDYDEVPKRLTGNKIHVYDKPVWDLGDRWKFFMLGKLASKYPKGFYFFSCDDDLYYQEWYFKHLQTQIDAYERKAIVGYHGVVLEQTPIKNYYEDRRAFPFFRKLPVNVCVQILGTGVMGFHSDTIQFSHEILPIPNMADVFVGKMAQELEIPMICVARDRTFVKQMTVNNSIYEKKRDNCSNEVEVINSINRKTNYTWQNFSN